jgi:hypothetical protein
MDHSIGIAEEDIRRGCRRARKPVLDKGTGKDGGPAKEAAKSTRRAEQK